MATTILGIAGSLRRGSFNALLLRNAAELAPEGASVEIATLEGVPLYDGDLEAESGSPAAVVALKERIVAADALLLVTPEYNNSMPGTFKNTIDWLSRPSSDIGRVFGGRRVGLMGATPGRGGTMLSQNAWLAVLRTLGTEPWFGGSVFVSGAGTAFDDAGKLTDDRTRTQVQKFMAGFVAFAQRPR